MSNGEDVGWVFIDFVVRPGMPRPSFHHPGNCNTFNVAYSWSWNFFPFSWLLSMFVFLRTKDKRSEYMINLQLWLSLSVWVVQGLHVLIDSATEFFFLELCVVAKPCRTTKQIFWWCTQAEQQCWNFFWRFLVELKILFQLHSLIFRCIVLGRIIQFF